MPMVADLRSAERSTHSWSVVYFLARAVRATLLAKRGFFNGQVHDAAESFFWCFLLLFLVLSPCFSPCLWCWNLPMREVVRVRTAARGAKRITAGRATARKEQAIEAIVSGSVSGREDNGWV